MSIEFRKKAYNKIRSILNDHDARVVGFDRNEFIVWTATRERLDDLKTLILNKRIVGIVVDTESSSFCFNLKKDKIYINKKVLSEKSILDYATEHLLVTGGRSVLELKNEINSNNEFIYSIVDFFTKKVERVNLNKIQIKYGDYTNLPYFYSANIINPTLNLYVTKHQMSLVTNSGFVKVHDTSKDVGSDYIANLVGDLFKIDKGALEDLIYQNTLTV